MASRVHQAVLVEETMQFLDVRSDGTYVDATLGGATHTRTLLERSAPHGHVLSLDVDRDALASARTTLRVYGSRWSGVEANFRDIEHIAKQQGFNVCDGIIMDLGLSSDALEDASRGLSFQIDGPLDMRFGPCANEDGLTAAEIVNAWRVDEIEQILHMYGGERYARRIATAIAEARRTYRIERTSELVSLVQQSVPRSYERGRIHPATRTFQALRMVVNDELEALRLALIGAQNILRSGGRLIVISFHSLEDRIVKQAFRDRAVWKSLLRKPLMASHQECAQNPRARSAKLRAAIFDSAAHP